MLFKRLRKGGAVLLIGAVCFLLGENPTIYAQDDNASCCSLKNNSIFICGQEAFSVSREGSLVYTYNRNSARNVFLKSKDARNSSKEMVSPASKLTVSPAKGVKIKKQRYNRKVASTISPFGTKLCSLKNDDFTVEVYYPNISTILEMNTDKSKEAWIVVEGIGISDVATTPIQKELIRLEYLLLVCKSKGKATRVMKIIFWGEEQPSSWYDNRTQTTLEEVQSGSNK
jgi:hypothetical protein